MAVILVPTDQPSLAAAIAAASPGDTIVIESSYSTVETVTVNKDNLTIDGQASFNGTVLNLAAGITTLNLPGPMTFSVNGNAANNVITSSSANVTISTLNGTDVISIEAGNSYVYAGQQATADLDRLIIDWSSTTGDVTGGYYSYSGHVSDAYGDFYSSQSGYYANFSGVEEFVVTSAAGNDNFATGNMNDTVSTGGGNDTVDVRTGDFTVDLGAGTADRLQADLGAETVAINIDLANQNIATDVGGGNYLTGVEQLVLNTGSGNDTIRTLDSLLDDTVTTGAGNDVVALKGGADYVDMGSDFATDFDRLVVDWSAGTGDISGGYYSYSGHVSEAYGTFSSSQSGYQIVFWGVDEFDVTAGSGNDSFTTGNLNDTVYGGAGNDSVNVQAGDFVVDLGTGDNDHLLADLSAESGAITVDLTDQDIATDIGGGNYLAGVERLSLTTGGGNDAIRTLGGLRNDSIISGLGDDQVTVAGGQDTVSMGEDGGTDLDQLTLDWSSTTGDVTGGYYSYSGHPTDTYGTFYNTENAGSDHFLTFSGVETYVVLTGSGNDDFYTGILNDTVSTGSGNDRVNMEIGDFVADLGAGDDDWLLANVSIETVAITVDLTDQDIATDIGGGNYLTGVERLTLYTGSGDDSIVTMSGRRHDLIDTYTGNDTVRIAGGNDTVGMGYGGTADSDRLIVDWSNTTGNVTGGYYSYISDASDGYGWFGNDEAGGTEYYASFEGVEEFHVITGSGNDNFQTGLLNDTVSTGAGDDLVNVQTGDFVADLGAGNADCLIADLSSETGAITIDLTDQDIATDIGGGNYLAGVERLAITTGGGDDQIETLDLLLADNITTGAGNDVVRIAGGNDTVYMGNGGATDLDTLIIDWSATTGDVTYGYYWYSGDASDTYGWFYNTQNSYADYYAYFDGVEEFNVTTGSGNDSFSLGVMGDTVSTGSGNDSVNVQTGHFIADLGAGNADYLLADLSGETDAITVDLTNQNIDIDIGVGSFLEGVEHLSLNTGSGDDRIVTLGLELNDSITTGLGNDEVWVAGGSDTVRMGLGGSGDDDVLVVDWSATTGDVTYGYYWYDGDPSDIYGWFYNPQNSYNAYYVEFYGVERFDIRTGSGNDNFNLGDGNDTARLSTGSDLVFMDGGDDHVWLAGDGNDSVYGGDGSDTLHIDFTGATPAGTTQWLNSFTASGYGTVYYGDFEHFDLDLGGGADTITLWGGDDTIAGNGGDDSLNAGDGDNVLSGGDGNDTLTSGSGMDTVIGGAGADSISTGAGNDMILVAGNDMIDGGADNDTVVLAADWAAYTISESGGTYTLSRAGETVQVTGVEWFAFTNGTFSVSDILNDDPVAGDDDNGSDAVIEAGGVANGTPGDATASGNVLANDSDADAPLGDTMTITSALTQAGIYGSLSMQANGNWTYTLNNALAATQAMAGGQTYYETFSYTITDVHGATDTATLTIEIAGSNDAAVMAPALANTTETNAPRTVTGTISFTDVDSPTTYQAQAGTVGLYGTLTLNTNGSYSYVMGSAHDEFAGGVNYDDVFTVTAADGTTSTLTIRIAGTNDAAVIGGTLSGAVAEDAGAGSNTSGTATSTDPDGTTNAFTAASGSTGYGSWTVNAAGLWTYALNNSSALVNNLSTGSTVIDSFTIAAADGTLQTVSVTINGANETITGGTGNDVLTGSAGADLINGTGGNDTINGNAGNDTIIGGAGADSMNGGTGTRDVLSYGSASPSGVEVNLSTGYANGGNATGDVFSGFEDLAGTTQHDTLTGSSGVNVISGSSGNDIIEGLGGGDTLNGGAGTDVVSYANSTAGVKVNLLTGATSGGHAQGDVITQFENIWGSGLNDSLSGGNGNNELRGNAGNDTLKGNAGVDTLLGGAGVDSLYGGTGDDSLDGGDNNDRLHGEADDDILIGGGGDDTLYGGGDDDSLYGGLGNDSLLGGGGANLMDGGEGDDRLTGNSGAETLIGGAGNDVLNAFGGSDRLDGGAGNDTLTGGVDAVQDVFVFALGYGSDNISQYTQGIDRLELDDALWAATPGLTGQQVVDTYGSLNAAGTVLTLTFGVDVVTVKDTSGIDIASFGADVIIV